MIHKDRIRHFTGILPENGRFVLYWMQQAQRVRFNHALVYAADRARDLGLPLVVGFMVTPGFPEAGLRHYRFMLEGIAEVQAVFARMGVPFVVRTGDMVETVLAVAAEAAWVVTDVGYLRIQRKWRKAVERGLGCPYTEVETDVVVPVKTASDKEEYGARTLRPKLLARVDDFLGPMNVHQGDGENRRVLAPAPSETIDVESLAGRVTGSTGASPAVLFRGGYSEARRHLDGFIGRNLSDYPKLSRDPAAQCQSDMSPYLHFGQISPVEIILAVRQSEAPEAAKDAYVEQLLVRRELAINFVHYNPGYDQYDTAVPNWAKKTLANHAGDPRSYIYSYDDFEAGRTHDPHWNAAQFEMRRTGKMHNYMRMYWGKKIIEWSATPEDAFDIMLSLNNRYELDGRDPNGFAGVAWCFGRHDRAWQERPIFGKVRYMNAAGLARKFRIADYVAAHPGL